MSYITLIVDKEKLVKEATTKKILVVRKEGARDVHRIAKMKFYHCKGSSI